MGIAEYERAVALMSERADMQDFVGPRLEQLIDSAENRLGLHFPPSYRRFLLEYGAGSFGSSEVYGVIDANFDHSSVPNGVWYTLSERRESSLPLAMFVIFNDGSGELFCLDCAATQAGGEAPVVRFQPGVAAGVQSRESIAADFGCFLLDLVQRERSRATRLQS